jgi:hypothetical protein
MADADTLFMKNGDRITGTLLGAQEGVVTISTAYAGDIQVQQTEVVGIETDDPRYLQDSDGALREGTLRLGETDQQLIEHGTPRRLPLETVRTIADTPDNALQKPEPEPEPKKWSGSAEFGAALRSGTTDTADATLTFTLKRTWPDWVLSLTGLGAYGEVESEINTRRAKGEVKLQRYFSERFYAYTLAGLEHDAARKLELRWHAGSGAGYDFIKNDTRTLFGELGLEYAWEEWTLYDLRGERAARDAAQNLARANLRSYLDALMPPLTLTDIRQGIQALYRVADPGGDNPTREEDYVTLFIASHYEQDVFKKSRFIGDLTVRPDLSDLDRYRLESLLSLKTPLAERLSLVVSLKSEYDSEPGSINVKKFDNTLLTTVHYDF